MADQSNDNKTEKPSAQKLRKTRERGEVVRSRDVATAIGILVCFKLIILLTPGYLQDFRTLFLQAYSSLDGENTLEHLWSTVFLSAALLLVKMLLPLFVVPLAVAVGSLFPGGWVFSVNHLSFRPDRLNPVANLQRLFTTKHASEMLVSILKALALGAVLFHVCKSTVSDYVRLQEMTLDQALLRAANLMVDGVMALCMVFIVFALIDLPVRRFFFLQGQRMSKAEVKEEHKSNEGRPEVRQRIRQLQHQIARRSVRKTVPTADVVIVNPEHYAVALKYDEARAEAPFLVAKGIDEMALYIREVATGSDIEIVTLPPLARAIYNTSQVNQQIPAILYNAVAHVLSYVLQLKAFQSGRRALSPALPDLVVPTHLT